MSMKPEPAAVPVAPIYVGIAVAKAHLDVVERPAGGPARPSWRVANTTVGHEELVARLRRVVPALIVAEARGGYEAEMVAALAVAGLPITVLNPRRVRDFAKASGHLAKTDALDAAVLAHFADALRPPVTRLPDAATAALAAVLERRRQIVEMLVAERHRGAQTRAAAVRARITTHVEWLEQELGALDAELHRQLQASPLWREQDAPLRGVPGVGPVLTLTLLADLPELGQGSARHGAALVGVAPFNRDTGQSRGPRAIWGGRAHVRAVLYMATLRAIRCNPTIATFYERLCQKGKAKKVAIVACMRKLLTILHAMLKHGTSWQPRPAPGGAVA